MFAKPSLEQPMFLFEKDRQNGCGLFCVGIRICIRQNALLTWKLAGGAPPTVRWVRIFVAGRGWGERRVGEFVVREGLWREPAPLAVKRARHAATVVEVSTAAADVEETLIGVFGASMGGILVKPMSSCEVYDVRLDRWHKLPDLPEARARPAAARLPGDSHVFVVGRWNPRDARLAACLQSGDSRVWNNSCVVFCGLNPRRTALASVVFCHLRADWRRQEATSANFWQSAASMRTARSGLAATAFRGAILVAGGAYGRDLNTVEMFTPPDARSPLCQWTELPVHSSHLRQRRLCSRQRHIRRARQHGRGLRSTG